MDTPIRSRITSAALAKESKPLPELPEVEAVCRRLRENLPANPTIVQARILRPSVSRPQDPRLIEEGVTGQRIRAVRRVGKHIFLELGSGQSLHIHLRMTGNLYVIPDVRLHVASTRAWFELRGKSGRGIVFDDPRALGKVHLQNSGFHPKVGPEPAELQAAEFVQLAKRMNRQPAKLFLMDQSKVAGLGNIYAAEALFRAGIHPAKPIARVTAPRLARLHQCAVEVLEEANESAYRAYTEPGYFAEAESFPVSVYDREGEPCTTCGRKIKRIPQGGRSTYFCSRCQR
jgi:formamidopyrimidine-DNA glycosylase